jgi:hypothetical protein
MLPMPLNRRYCGAPLRPATSTRATRPHEPAAFWVTTDCVVVTPVLRPGRRPRDRLTRASRWRIQLYG